MDKLAVKTRSRMQTLEIDKLAVKTRSKHHSGNSGRQRKIESEMDKVGPVIKIEEEVAPLKKDRACMARREL